MKHGFMLIELIIATLIASMIGTLLLTALSQGMRFQQIIDTEVDFSLRVGIVNNQLEKDFMGAFIPMQARIKEEKEEVAEKPEAAKKGEQKTEKKTEPKKEEKEEKKSKPAEKPLEKIFYGTIKEGQLDTLTFVTNNPLVVFVGQDTGVVKPKVARVQYTLKREQEKDKESPFVLLRQESSELDLTKYTNIRSYELVGGIKECKVKYTARIEKGNEQAKEAPAQKGAEKNKKESPKEQPKTASVEKQKISYEYKVLDTWVSEQKEEAAQKKENSQEPSFPRIPYMIEFSMTLWNMARTKTQEFTFMFELPINLSSEKDESDNDDVDEKKENKADKNKQEKKDDLANSLMVTLGNISKIFKA